MGTLLRPVFWAGLFCAVLDFAAVTSFYSLKAVPVVRVWQAVASGLWGRSAFLRGWTSASAGLGVHLVVAFSTSAVFCLATRELPTLAHRYLLYGPIYGVGVFLFMNFIVVPLSALPRRPLPAGIVRAQLMIHVFCVGLPISFSAYRFSK